MTMPSIENLQAGRAGAVWRRILPWMRHLSPIAAIAAALGLAAAGLIGFGAATAVVAAATGFLVLMAIGPPATPGRIADLPSTSRRQAQAGSPSSAGEEAWRAIVDALSDAALVVDADTSVLHHNRQAQDLFSGLRAGQALSHTLRNPDLIAATDRILAGGSSEQIIMIERVPVERRLAARISRLAAAGVPPAVPAVLVVFEDLTEQERLAQMRADFIANASHELRTPLASLRGFVETLQGPARDDAAARARFLDIMSSQASRMTRLIDDLLSLSRVEMRTHITPSGVVDLNEVVVNVQQGLEPLAKSSKASLELFLLDGPARIRGDRDEVVQVVQNLVQNAIKYGREGGRVSVTVTREEALQPGRNRLAVAVRDDGHGIAPEHLPRLTERFYRANVTTSREKGGTGLGLAIVKHILIRHRGDLRIASTVGEGSTFTAVFDEFAR